ncbi:MAG: efflux RND transporter periplasmic adaptor subunit [Mesorhizobium sp.]
MIRSWNLLLAAFAVFAAPSLSRAGEFVVHATTVAEMKAVFGQVESRIVVPARARIGGSVRQIMIGEGDQVKEGQVVALVVDDKLALQLAAADARIEALGSQLENARLEFERAQQLQASGTGTQSRLDLARTQFEVATKQVAAAEADKAVIEQGEREGEVLAPSAGRVLTVSVTPGSVVMAGEPIARVAPGPYHLRLLLPERHAAEIVQGAEVLVGGRGLAPAAGAEAGRQGLIVKVYPEIADGRVIADVDVAGIGDYFVNERTLVSIPVGRRSVLAVPPEAVRTVHGVDYVRVVAPAGKTPAVEIDVAVILGETFEDGGTARVEVLSGLVDGDRVVLP